MNAEVVSLEVTDVLKYTEHPERRLPSCIRNTVSHGGGTCMLWAGISVDRASFHSGEWSWRRLTANKYIRFILQVHVVLNAGFIGGNFIFMDDYARYILPSLHVRTVEDLQNFLMEEWNAISQEVIRNLILSMKRRVEFFSLKVH